MFYCLGAIRFDAMVQGVFFVIFKTNDPFIIAAVLTLPRPCSACERKGYAADQCTDGCEPCRRARVRCEDGNGKPCKRCREMKIGCADVPLAHGGGQPANVAFVNVMPASSSTVTQDAAGALQRTLVIDTNGVDRLGGVNGCFNSVSGSNTMTLGGDSAGRTMRGTERAKLACVGCRRDNKKASLRKLTLYSFIF
jgi:hypothetical protein